MNREKCLAYYWKNRERNLAQMRLWYRQHRNPERLAKARVKTVQWRLNNPVRARILQRVFTCKRRALLRQVPGVFGELDVKRLWWFQKGRCQYCKACLIKYQVDHIIPLIRGGTNYPQNLCLACVSCNASKGAKTAEEFYALRRIG